MMKLILKSVVFLYTNNKPSERNENNPIHNFIKRINLIKDVKDLYTENCKTLIKAEEDTINEKYSMFMNWKINMIKCPYPKQSTVNEISKIRHFSHTKNPQMPRKK